MTDGVPRPTCFISYSWDHDDHRDWVLGLAHGLEDHGIEVALDRYVEPGASLTQFMEVAVRSSDFVVLVCTPHFAERANERRGGVGYEAQIVTSEIYARQNSRKFVPLLRSGDHDAALPTYLAGRKAIDFRPSADYRESLDELVRHIWSTPAHRPRLGPPPEYAKPLPVAAAGSSPSSYSSRVHRVAVDEPIPGSQGLDPPSKALLSRVSGEPRPVLVHFWAEWCGPCKMIAPVLDQLAKDTPGLRLMPINIDEDTEVAREEKVMSIPTMTALYGGQRLKTVVGAKPLAALKRDLDDVLSLAQAFEEQEAGKASDDVALTLSEGRVRLVRIRSDGTYTFLDGDEQRHGLLYLPRSFRGSQFRAIRELEELLNDPHVSRAELRGFLEEHPDLLLQGAYRSAYSRVLLREDTRGSTDPAGPDFVLQPLVGELCDLLQVLPAQQDLASNVDGLATLTDVVLEAVAQLRAYADYFEDEANRLRIEAARGIKIFRPRMFVIIGKSRRIDPITRRRLESHLGAGVTVRTWDEVLALAESNARD